MTHINWSLIHRFAQKVGGLLARPFRLLYPDLTWIPPEQDVWDEWSFAHSLATAFIFWCTFTLTLSRSFASATAFFIMLFYELYIDGLRLEDERGASEADIGYNTIGLLLALFSTFLRWNF